MGSRHGAPVGEMGGGMEGRILVIGKVGVDLPAGDHQYVEAGLGQGLLGRALAVGDVLVEKSGESGHGRVQGRSRVPEDGESR